MTQRMKQYVKERWIFCTVILSLVVLIGATVTWTAAESQIFSVKQDDGAYTAAGATSGVNIIGGFSDNTDPDSVSEGDVGALRMSANRNLFSTIRDAAGNERGANVTANNDLETQVSAPLGSAAAAASVSIAPPTDAMFRVSDDTSANAVGNPMFFSISDGTEAASVTTGNDLEVQVSAPLGSAAAASSVSIAPPTDARFQCSDDTAANAIGNPMWFEITDGTHSAEVTATNELEIDIASQTLTAVKVSDDANANAVGNPMFFSLSDGTETASVTTGNDLEVQISAPLGSAAAASSVSVAPATDARFQCSDDTAANALANPMFFQISDGTHGAEVTATNELEVDIASQTLTAVKISDDANANTVSNQIFTQPTNGTNGVDILAAIADDVALTNNPMIGQCMLGLYDGTYMDMGRAGASGELQVTDIATRAGENAGDGLVETRKLRLGHTHEDKMTHTTINEVEQIVCHSMEVIEYPNFCIWLANNDSTDHALTDMDVQVSPDDFATASSTIELAEIASCDLLAAGVGCVGCYSNNAYRYVRVNATGLLDHGVTSLDCWITGNMN